MKVLVADDDTTFRTLVIEVLTDAGYEVSAHENGLLAWEHLQAEGADLAVLDINMPEMDGIQVLGHIRTDDRFKDMPVLLLTIRAFTEDQVNGYEKGADDYLTKPFDNDVLVARVKVLERRILGK
jgi:two-component system OmpR family response regulator